jgi:DNA-binding NtrC family response regulator
VQERHPGTFALQRTRVSTRRDDDHPTTGTDAANDLWNRPRTMGTPAVAGCAGTAMETTLHAVRSTPITPVRRAAPTAVPGLALEWTTHSPASREFLHRLAEAAKHDGPVYLHGEPGSGLRCAAGVLRRWRAEQRPGRPAGGSGNGAPFAAPTILRVPSLRERPEDLPAIAEECLAALARSSGKPQRYLTATALDDLRRRELRGNICELACLLETAVRRAGSRVLIEVADLPHTVTPVIRPSQRAKEEAQRDCLLGQLRVAGTVSGAARLEGCARSNYIRLMHRLGIMRADAR